MQDLRILTDNPYAPPQDSSQNQYPATARSHLKRTLLMLPFSLLAALCVVIVNCLPIVMTMSFRLYWTMFCWQFLMMQFFGSLSIPSQDRTQV